MYSNGGYLQLDFKNANISGVPQKIEGITFEKILKTNKPIILTNILSIDTVPVVLPSYILGRKQDNTVIQLWGIFSSLRIRGILIDNNDNITSVVYSPASEVTALQVESEVSTNASKSDSNTDK